MFTRVFRIKKEAKILISRIAFVALSAVGLTLLSPVANANDYPIINGDNCWAWRINYGDDILQDINDLQIDPISDCDGDDEDYIQGDLYDGFGRGVVNDDTFNWYLSDSYVDGVIVDDVIVIPGDSGIPADPEDPEDLGVPGDDTAGSEYTVAFSDNNVIYEINSTSVEDNLRIWGNLGSDSRTRFITLGGHLFSYEVSSTGEYPEIDGPQNFMPVNDPILLWETNGSVKSMSSTYDPTTDTTTLVVLDTLNDYWDRVNVSITGDTLRLQHFAFAYQINGAADQVNFSENTELFFTQFLNFVNEDQTRTDVFTFNWTPAPALAPALRQTKNLSFTKSLYGTDKLSDPDGQLRKTLDSIDVKFGSLIK